MSQTVSNITVQYEYKNPPTPVSNIAVQYEYTDIICTDSQSAFTEGIPLVTDSQPAYMCGAIKIEVSEDTFVFQAGEYNYGQVAYIQINNNTFYKARTLLRFDLSSISPYTEILSAKLVLTGYGGYASSTFNIYKITDANGEWIEGTKTGQIAGAGEPSKSYEKYNTETWAGSAMLWTAGTDYVNTVLATITSGIALDTEYDFIFNESGITVLESWLGQSTNNGFLLTTSGTYSSEGLRFHSKQSGDNYPAYLLLTYNEVQEADDSSSAFVQGIATASDSTSAFTEGVIASNDSTSAYLAGIGTLQNNISVYLIGSSSEQSNTDVYLYGNIYTQDSTPAFISSGSTDLDSTPTYLEGVGAANSSVSAYIPVSGQLLTPDEDINVNQWVNESSSTPLYPSVADGSDSTYVWINEGSVGETFTVGLSTPTYDVVAGRHFLSWRVYDKGALNTVTLKIELYDDTTLIKSDTETLTGTVKEYILELSSGEISSISAYTDLSVKITIEGIT